jgi:hypothetical protein
MQVLQCRQFVISDRSLICAWAGLSAGSSARHVPWRLVEWQTQAEVKGCGPAGRPLKGKKKKIPFLNPFSRGLSPHNLSSMTDDFSRLQPEPEIKGIMWQGQNIQIMPDHPIGRKLLDSDS